MIQTVFGLKQGQTQVFLENGGRVSATTIAVSDLPVVQVKTNDKDSYYAVQVGIGNKKKPTSAQVGHSKKANLQIVPVFLREIRVTNSDGSDLPKPGDTIKLSDVLKPGDIINVTGTSKGKGFAGGVKRYGFKGGPRTHGQSDRERAPGSIGQTTTPGRVYKGKRMAGHMGHVKVTLRNLMVLDVTDTLLVIKGLVPGGRNSLIRIEKVGEHKKFVPVFKIADAKEESTMSTTSITGTTGDETVEASKEEAKVEEVAVEAKDESAKSVEHSAEGETKEEKEEVK